MGMEGDGNYYFDEEAADRVCRFFEQWLVLWEGADAGQPFRLMPWQRNALREIFGWKRRSDDTRRYRVAYLEVPRKTGKTPLASGIALYMLFADGEPGAQVYSAACTRAQATVSFNHAKEMLFASDKLSKHLTPKQYTIEHSRSRSTYRVLSGEKRGKHGKNISGIVIDELHEWTDPTSREFFTALTTSMGSRRQPLTVMITTAGYGDEPTLCSEYHEKAIRVLAGDSEDKEFYGYIAAAAPTDDPFSPETWRKAIPSLGVTVSESFLQAESIKAKEQPSFLNEFKRYYLNIWTQAASRWLNMEQVSNCINPTITYEQLKGKRCVIGVDLAQTYDLAAVVLLYLGEKWSIIPRLYCPAAMIDKRTRDDLVPYKTWLQCSHIIGTEASNGKAIDYKRIEADLLQICKENDVVEVAYDPYNALSIMNAVESAGTPTVPVYQRFNDMSRACKELERRLSVGEIVLPDNPALFQAFSNVEVESDRHGNIRPVKPHHNANYAGTAKYKIDAVVATITAISRAMLLPTTATAKEETKPQIFFV